MKKTNVRLISALLVILMLIMPLAATSCAEVEDEVPDTTAAPVIQVTDPQEVTEEDTTPEFVEADYGGADFTVLSRDPKAASYPAFYIGTEEPTDVMS
ncbi:MAG: hypothetical protein IKJ04_08625, partial [Clostridia bacterium]|nr:hypothetical protein [Clostridia bacterium]